MALAAILFLPFDNRTNRRDFRTFQLSSMYCDWNPDYFVPFSGHGPHLKTKLQKSSIFRFFHYSDVHCKSNFFWKAQKGCTLRVDCQLNKGNLISTRNLRLNSNQYLSCFSHWVLIRQVHIFLTHHMLTKS
jgi:hypothetical protein